MKGELELSTHLLVIQDQLQECKYALSISNKPTAAGGASVDRSTLTEHQTLFHFLNRIARRNRGEINMVIEF